MTREIEKSDPSHSGQMVRVTAVAAKADVNAPSHPQQASIREIGFARWLGSVIGLCKKYTAEDVSRLKEAGVQIVEYKAQTEGANARLVAAAASKVEEEVRRIAAETRTREVSSQIENMVAAAEAVERVADAISKFRQNGGDVIFDMNEMRQLISRVLGDFPNDPRLGDLRDIADSD